MGTVLWRTILLLAAWHLAAMAPAQSFQVQDRDTLKIALISWPDSPAQGSGETAALLKNYLEGNHPIQCVLLKADQADSLAGIEALDQADAAVFLLPGKTEMAQNMTIPARFFDSGKGLVALGAASEGWENRPSFDTEVLGAKYEGTFGRPNPPRFVYMHPHPIFTGARGFQTTRAPHQYGPPAPDVHVIMEGRTDSVAAPMAWTRERNGGRVFHFVPSHAEDFQDPAYLRIIANSILWVARQPIPDAETAVVRGIMPESYPGAFAVVFPEGPSLCFDPVRGGINYIWTGTFIDFRPNWTGKVGRPATIGGARFYEETVEQPLRRGRPDKVPEFQFQGYRMRNGFPTFFYRIDDCHIREELHPLPGGRGIARHFQTDAPGEMFWLLTGAQPAALCSSAEGDWRDGRLRVRAGDTGAFTVVIKKSEGAE